MPIVPPPVVSQHTSPPTSSPIFSGVKEYFELFNDKKEIEKSLESIKEIAAVERKNALDSIECLKKDSRLGFEPTEDYSISGTTLTLTTALVATDKITTEVF